MSIERVAPLDPAAQPALEDAAGAAAKSRPDVASDNSPATPRLGSALSHGGRRWMSDGVGLDGLVARLRWHQLRA